MAIVGYNMILLIAIVGFNSRFMVYGYVSWVNDVNYYRLMAINS